MWFIGFEAGIDYPAVYYGEIGKSVEVGAIGVLAVAHPNTELANPLDKEKRERTASQHRRIVGEIGGKFDFGDWLAVMFYAGPFMRDKTHFGTVQHKGASLAG